MRVLNVRSGRNEILDADPSEGTIEAMLLRELWWRGILAFAQVRVLLDSPSSDRSMTADVVIVRAGQAIGMVEVKRREPQERDERQRLKYDLTGLPWRYCTGMRDIDDTIEWAKTL